MSLIRFQEQAEPDTPPAGKASLFVDSVDGEVAVKKDNGDVQKFLTSVSEAPNDGKQYSRQSAAWELLNTLYDVGGVAALQALSGGNLTLNQFGSGRIEPNVIAQMLGITNTGELVQQIPNEGQVKLNGSGGIEPSIIDWVANEVQTFLYDDGALDLSSVPTTSWPKNIAAPVGADIIDPVNFRFLENPIPGQVHMWRIQYKFSGKASNSTLGLTLGLRNPISGFTTSRTDTLSSGITASPTVTFPDLSTKQLPSSVILTTIADLASIGVGYQLFGSSTVSDANLAIAIESVTRVSEGFTLR